MKALRRIPVRLSPADGVVGDTFTLTANVDNVTGTADNDTFYGANGTSDTFTTPDVLDGAGGTDTFNLTLDTGAVIPAAGVSNIENFFVRNVSGGGLTIDYSVIAGEAQVWNDRSADALTFTNLATDTTVGVKGDGALSVAATTFSMATKTDAVSIAIDGGVKGGAAITNDVNTTNGTTETAGPASAMIASSGAANTVGYNLACAGYERCWRNIR